MSSVERGVGDRSAGERAQHDGVVALLEHRLLGDLPVGRIAEPRHQLVVLGFGLRSLPARGGGGRRSDRRCAGTTTGRARPPSDRARVPSRAGCARPSGSACLSSWSARRSRMSRRRSVVFALGEQPVRRGRLDFAAPHLLDGGEVLRVDRHASSRCSKTTTVPMPAATSSTCRGRVRVEGAAVQVGDEVRHRDVEEAGAGEREQVRRDVGQRGRRQRMRAAAPATPAASATALKQRARGRGCSRGAAGSRSRRPRAGSRARARRPPSLTPSGIDVSDRGADDGAVHEVVRRVADEEQRRRRAVDVALVGVAVPPDAPASRGRRR